MSMAETLVGSARQTVDTKMKRLCGGANSIEKHACRGGFPRCACFFLFLCMMVHYVFTAHIELGERHRTYTFFKTEHDWFKRIKTRGFRGFILPGMISLIIVY